MSADSEDQHIEYTGPGGIAIDSMGNYIITEHGIDKLSKITPSGIRFGIYNFTEHSCPIGIAIIPMQEPVGGEILPFNAISLVAPWIVTALAAIAMGVGITSRKKIPQ